LLASLSLIGGDKNQRDSLAQEVSVNESMSEVCAEDLAGCLSSHELQTFVSEENNRKAKFNPIKG